MSNENDYFKQKDQDLLHETKRATERVELRKLEIDQIAKNLGTTPELAEEVYELGFDAEAVRILHLVPVIQVAWVDGAIQEGERKKLIELAEMREITKEKGGPGWSFFELITSKEPKESFFKETNRVIAKIIRSGGNEKAGTLLENCKNVAEASGGFLNLYALSRKEQKLLEEFAHLFKDDNP